jgi:ribonuclease P protein component
VQRRHRLTRKNDIKRVRQEGRSLANAMLVLGYLPNQLEQNRTAVIAGRSVGGAVQRNYAKRRIRSALSTLQPELTQGYDLVLIARKPLLDSEYQYVIDGMQSLLSRAGLLKEKAN